MLCYPAGARSAPAGPIGTFRPFGPAGVLRRRLLHRNGTFVPPAPPTRTRRRVKTDFRRKTGRGGPFFHQSGWFFFEDLAPVWHFRMGLKGQTHQPGCIPPRSNLDPPGSTNLGPPGHLLARFASFMAFGAVFGHKNGQKGQKLMGSTWISYFLNQTDKIEPLVRPK